MQFFPKVLIEPCIKTAFRVLGKIVSSVYLFCNIGTGTGTKRSFLIRNNLKFFFKRAYWQQKLESTLLKLDSSMVLGKKTELWRQTDDNFKKKIHVLLRFGTILRLFRLEWSFYMALLCIRIRIYLQVRIRIRFRIQVKYCFQLANTKLQKCTD